MRAIVQSRRGMVTQYLAITLSLVAGPSCGDSQGGDSSATLGGLSCDPSSLALYDGTSWECITAYDGADFTLSNQACGDGERAVGIDASGALICDANTLGALDCSDGQIAVSDQDAGEWICGAATSTEGGDITAVTAGAGLTGGSASGDATLTVDFGGNGAADQTARSDHDHNTAYASPGHNHDVSYASTGHNHDVSYASTGHNHDADYGAIDHTHSNLVPLWTEKFRRTSLDTTFWSVCDFTTSDCIDEGFLEVSSSPPHAQFVSSSRAIFTANTTVDPRNCEYRLHPVRQTGGGQYVPATTTTELSGMLFRVPITDLSAAAWDTVQDSDVTFDFGKTFDFVFARTGSGFTMTIRYRNFEGLSASDVSSLFHSLFTLNGTTANLISVIVDERCTSFP